MSEQDLGNVLERTIRERDEQRAEVARLRADCDEVTVYASGLREMLLRCKDQLEAKSADARRLEREAAWWAFESKFRSNAHFREELNRHYPERQQ